MILPKIQCQAGHARDGERALPVSRDGGDRPRVPDARGNAPEGTNL